MCKTKKCEDCGREAGIAPFLSRWRTYNVVVVEYGQPHERKMLCQWCRAKRSRQC